MTGTVKTGRTGRYVGWRSHSTWIALLIILFYVVFTFVLPVIPLYFIFGAIGGPLVAATPFVALVIWLAVMAFRIFGRKNRKLIIWTALRYGVIALGGTGIAMMLLSMSTPWHVRRNERFAEQMRREADIPAIRAWAEEALFGPEEPTSNPCIGGRIYLGELPDCVKTITGFNYIAFSREDKLIDFVFGGGFGHWGLTIAPLGTEPEGHYILPIEDGAWVWQEMQ